MKRIALFLLLAAVAAPSAFACQDCPDGVQCVVASEGFSGCFETQDTGCHTWGGCGLATTALASQYRIASVRVIESGKPLPAAKKAPAPVLAAAK